MIRALPEPWNPPSRPRVQALFQEGGTWHGEDLRNSLSLPEFLGSDSFRTVLTFVASNKFRLVLQIRSVSACSRGQLICLRYTTRNAFRDRDSETPFFVERSRTQQRSLIPHSPRLAGHPGRSARCALQGPLEPARHVAQTSGGNRA